MLKQNSDGLPRLKHFNQCRQRKHKAAAGDYCFGSDSGSITQFTVMCNGWICL